MGVDEKRVSAPVGEIEEAWNTHGMGRSVGCLAEGADFVNVRGWWWRGRGEIEQKHASFARRFTPPTRWPPRRRIRSQETRPRSA